MKKLNCSKELELDVFYEKLDNGLEIYSVPMKNKDKYYLTYGTHFGSTATKFIPSGEKNAIKVPDGIAHFLEHKMFEMEDGVDPFTHFAKNGTDCNAFTNYDSTRYIAVGTKAFKDDLKYLIKYVNSPYFTDENVEKEKGIIAQEINMYKDEAEYMVEDTLRKNLYKKDNHRVDIAGEVSDIETITKEDLYLCYDNFYSPNNMFLIVVGNFNEEELESIIEEDLKPLKNKFTNPPNVIYEKEPAGVVKKSEKKNFNISIPKLMIGIKTRRDAFKLEDEVKLDLYLGVIARIVFGNASIFRERMAEDNLLTRFYTDVESINDYKIIYLYGESTKPDKLLEEIIEETKNIKITIDDLNRMKKVLIASEIKQADYVDGVMSSIASDVTRYNKFIEDPINLYKNLNLKELKDVLKNIDFKTTAVVTYIPDNMASYEE